MKGPTVAGLARLSEVQRKPICLSGSVSFNEETLKLLYVRNGEGGGEKKKQDGLEGQAGGKHGTIYGADNIMTL